MKTETSGDGRIKNRSKNYFIVAAIFFLLMALVWSLDASLVYIFLGVACFFLFLGFFHRPSTKNYNHSYQKSYQQEKRNFGGGPSFEDTLKTFFGNKTFQAPGSTAGSQSIQGRKIILVVILFIFLMTLIPIIVSIFSSDSGSYDGLGYYATAEQQYLSQEYDSAYVNYRRAMRANPEHAEAIVGYGNVLAVRNERDSAILMFNRALEINPAYKEAVYYKGLALYDQKKYNDGIALVTPLLEENPDYYDGMLLLGDLYYIQGKYDEAITWYENVYQNSGSRTRILCHIMAYIYDKKGESEKAISLYQEALSYDSSIVDIYQRLGEMIPGENGNFYRSKAAELKP